jgi:hypothetical protein
LSSRQAHMRLTPGLPSSVRCRWSVRIAPEVGEPYLSRWKDYLSEQVRRSSAAVAAGASGPPARAKREVKPKACPKRPREDAPPPPSNTREERIKRLRAAQAAPAVQVAGRRFPPSPPRPTGTTPPSASPSFSGPLSALSLSSRSLSLSVGEAGAGAPHLPRSPPPGVGAGLAGPQPVAGPGVPPPPTAPT